jgi:SpoVK/Ycf46/Vps4 family AAA+-type ATPase
MHVLSEAKRIQPCVVFVPHIDSWWEDEQYEVLRNALLAFLQDLDPSFPMLLFATADRPTVSPAHHLLKYFGNVVECTVPAKVFFLFNFLLASRE